MCKLFKKYLSLIVEITCSIALTNLVNGQIPTGDFAVGSQATFTCADDFFFDLDATNEFLRTIGVECLDTGMLEDVDISQCLG